MGEDPTVTIAPVTPGAVGFDRLLAQSRQQGHRMLQWLDDNWYAGLNVFNKPGEVLHGAWHGDTLIGICGRNVDPYDTRPRTGRVRHLYVDDAWRRHGVGRLLVGSIIDGANVYFDYLNTNAPSSAFKFYEAMGFSVATEIDYGTHRLRL